MSDAWDAVGMQWGCIMCKKQEQEKKRNSKNKLYQCCRNGKL